MKEAFQKNAQKRTSPLKGMFTVLLSICAFLAFLVLLTAAVHFIVM